MDHEATLTIMDEALDPHDAANLNNTWSFTCTGH